MLVLLRKAELGVEEARSVRAPPWGWWHDIVLAWGGAGSGERVCTDGLSGYWWKFPPLKQTLALRTKQGRASASGAGVPTGSVARHVSAWERDSKEERVGEEVEGLSEAGERHHVCLKEKKSLRSRQPGAWVEETASHAAEATSAPL